MIKNAIKLTQLLKYDLKIVLSFPFNRLISVYERRLG